MIRKEVLIKVDLSNINYQEVVNLYVDMMSYAIVIGTIWGLLERLVIMFFDAVMDRWRKRSGL